MERVISPEERIRRAEEIYYRRKAQGIRVSSSSVNVRSSNKISLGKKMTIQILICVVIYTVFFMLKGYNNVFSENVIMQTRNILNYDINFQKLYNQCVEYFNNNFNSIIKVKDNIQNGREDNGTNNDNQDKDNGEGTENGVEQNDNIQGDENSIDEESQQSNGSESDLGGLQENDNLNEQNQIENNETTTDDYIQNSGEENNTSQNVIIDGTQKAKIDAENETQMKADAEYIKQNYNLIHPIEGIITSRFGDRDETEIISAFHQGIDISAVTGTAIHASMEGTVVAASYAGGYGNHVKIQNGEILTVYAHCSELEVEVGEHINQNQEVAKVGATGDVTGPHLHFEVRRDGRYVNPELILSF